MRVRARTQAQLLAAIARSSHRKAKRLELVTALRSSYPLQHRVAFFGKAVDKRSGRLYGAAIAPNGDVVDAARLLARESAVRSARFGTLDPALVRRLARRPNALVRVLISLRGAGGEPPDRPRGAPLESNSRKARRDARRAAADASAEAARTAAERARAVVRPALRRLAAVGVRARPVADLPLLAAAATRAQLRAASRLPVVEGISPQYATKNELEVAKPTVGATYMNSTLGVTGAGVRVGQDEVGGRVDTSNPILGGNITVAGTLCYAGSDALHQSHATGVAGIIHSSRGIAPGTSLYATGSCSGDSDALIAAAKGAVSWGAKVVNHSWGMTHFFESTDGQADRNLTEVDRAFDRIVVNTPSTQVFAAGNTGGYGSYAWVMTPARSYNTLAVANYDDKNTANDWSDDVVSSSSGWVNPYSVNGDREKPDVAAPGSNTVRDGPYYTNFFSTVPLSINSTGWASIGEGTSYAAPVVTGEIALLAQRAPTLAVWPEAVRAIVMATAVGNPDGLPPRYGSTDLSDGAGGIWIPYADRIARGVNGNWRGVRYSCGTATPYTVMTATLAAGRATRAVIAWDQNPDYGSYLNQPSADLDLQVIGPSGALVAESTSADNTTEMAEFTPPTTGTYSFRVVKYRCNADPYYLGAAWSQP